MPNSNRIETQKPKERPRTKIAEALKKIGITRPGMIDLLESEVNAEINQAKCKGDAALAKAKEKAEQFIARAKQKAANVVASAEDESLKKVLDPIHICRILAEMHTKPLATEASATGMDKPRDQAKDKRATRRYPQER